MENDDLTIWRVYQTCGNAECQRKHAEPVRIVAGSRHAAAMIYFYKATGGMPIVRIQMLAPKLRDDGAFDVVCASTPIEVEDAGERFSVDEAVEQWGDGLKPDMLEGFGFVLDDYRNRTEGQPVAVMAGVREVETVLAEARHAGEEPN